MTERCHGRCHGIQEALDSWKSPSYLNYRSHRDPDSRDLVRGFHCYLVWADMHHPGHGKGWINERGMILWVTCIFDDVRMDDMTLM